MDCSLCYKPIPDDKVADFECFGCGGVICEDCDVGNSPFGHHEVWDHETSDEDDE